MNTKAIASLAAGVAAAFLTLAAPKAQAQAEIQIFINYQGSGVYDTKYVSTFDRPLSASYLYVPWDGTPTNGACFRGDPNSALNLFSTMVDIFNRESYSRAGTVPAVSVWGRAYYDRATDAPALEINARDANGRAWTWFPRMRECVRWSTPDERANSPYVQGGTPSTPGTSPGTSPGTTPGCTVPSKDCQPGAQPTPTPQPGTQPGVNQPNQGGDQPNQGNQPNQGGNQPNQGGNQPNQGDQPNQGNQPNQGGNQPTQGGDQPVGPKK